MPKLGEIRYGRDLGLKGSLTNKFIWYSCEICGKTRWVQMANGQPRKRLCSSCARRGECHPLWKGGRRKKSGYVEVRIYPEDFFFPMADKRGWVREHRLIVAKALGRCLLHWEIVHHKSGFAKDDNRYPETLELITDKRFHMVDAQLKAYIKRLESRIKQLEARVIMLEVEKIAGRV